MKSEKVTRLTPKKETLRALFAKSQNKCAFPGCESVLIDEDNEFIGQVCHIEAAEEGGERFNENQTNEERRSFNNLILLCYPHHVKTNDIVKYPVEKLKEIKAAHEAAVSAEFEIANIALNRIYNNLLTALSKIQADTTAILKNTIKSDSDLEFIKTQLETLTNQKSVDPKSVQDELPELQNIRKLRLAEKQKSALLIIADLKKNSKWNNLSNDLKSRVTINEAICHLELDNSKEAANLFIEALKWNPNNADSLSYAAFGYSLLGEKDDSLIHLNRALQIDPKNINAYNSLIRISSDIKYEDLLQKIPLEIQSVPEICFNLAVAARNQGLFEKSISLFQKGIDNGGQDLKAHYQGALGSTILESVTSDGRSVFQYVTRQLSIDSKAKVRYALDLLTEAWESVKKTDLKENHSSLLLNRGIAKKFLADFEGAYIDIKEAFDMQQNDYFVCRHYLIICYESKKFDQFNAVSDLLVQLASPTDLNETLLLKAELLLSMNKANEALTILQGLSSEADKLEKKYKRQLDHCFISAYLKTKDNESALAFSEKLRLAEPDEATPFIESAILYFNIGEKEEAEKFAIEAFGKITKDTDPEELHELSSILYNLSIFDKGVQLLERITDTSIYSHLTKNLIRGYIRCGKTKEALNLLRKLEEEHGLDRFGVESLCVIYESIGDVNASIQVCNRYLAINPDDQIILLRLAFSLDRLEYKIEVADTLMRMSNVDYTLHFEALFRLSDLFFKCGNTDKALEIAYEARRINYNIGQCHLKYFGLISSFDFDLTDGQSDIVTPDSAVKLSNQGESTLKSYIIEKRSDTLIERGEINTENALALKLLGKKVNDNIEIDKKIGPKQTFTIREIQTKHLFAFQESVTLLGTRFIDEPGFQIFNTGTTGNIKEDLKFIFQSLDESAKFDEQLNYLYKNHQITIGFYAKIRRSNPIKAISVIISQPDLGIYSFWVRQEFLFAKTAIDAGTEVVVDLTTLVILSIVNSLTVLEKLPNKITVAQTVFDTIKDQIHELSSMGSKGFMTVGKVGDQYVRDEVKPEQVKRNIDHYTNLLEWIKSHCSIEPCDESLNIDQAEKARLDELLGTCFIDTILIAKSKKAVLLSDESVLRQIANREHGVSGTNTFALVTALLSKRMVTREEGTDIFIKLFAHNLKGLPIDEHGLKGAALRAKYSSAFPFTTIVQGLSSLALSDRHVSIIAVNFFYDLYSDSGIQIYSSSPINIIRQNLVMLVISELAKRPNFNFKILSQMIILKFTLLQPQKDELIALINDLTRQL